MAELLTVLHVLNKGTAYLKRHGIGESARLDAEVLLAHSLHLTRVDLYVQFDRPLSPQEADAYRRALQERAKHKPVAYITGHKEFYGRDFLVDPRVLIPRPETELLVETLLKLPLPQGGAAPPLVIEVGTGSGAIAITLALEGVFTVVATDISAAALAVAEENAARLAPGKVQFCQCDLLPPLPAFAGQVSAIITNPPYIPTGTLAQLMPSVRAYEPKLALDGGPDGLDYYRRLFTAARPYLCLEGVIVCELGAGQAPAVGLLAEAAGYTIAELRKDYAGWERVLVARRRE